MPATASASLHALANPQKAIILARFFKTGPGQYGAGDRFLGITVPQIRKLCKEYRYLPLAEIIQLLHSPFHEERLLALLIMVKQYQKGNQPKITTSDLQTLRQQLYTLYLENYQYINNWDLVDLSAEHLVGAHLAPEAQGQTPTTLLTLAKCQHLWKNRIAILATFHYIKLGNPQPTLALAKILLNHPHDLIHKAVGWMLREVGKRCSRSILLHFLDEYHHQMPRTCLRYSIEHLSPEQRSYYLQR